MYGSYMGKTLRKMRRHRGAFWSSSSSWGGAWRGPSMASARWRAHSLRLWLGSQSSGCRDGCPFVGACCDEAPGGDAIAISMSLGRDCVRCGALKILRPAIAPPIRLPRSPRAAGGRAGGADRPVAVPVAEVGGGFPARALRARTRLICRSRRTITLVILTGHTPVGSTVRLHMGHREEWPRRNGSMHSGWKMWWQGSSRTWHLLGSKSSMHIGQVGCDQELDVADCGTSGADEWRVRGGILWPVSALTADEGPSDGSSKGF